MTRQTRLDGYLGSAWRCALLALFAASGASAGELLLGATSEYAFSSNFFSSSVDEDPANSFLLGPTLAYSDDYDRFDYDLSYTGAYQLYVDQSGADNWESYLRARASYELDSRTTLRLMDRFRDVSNLRFSRQDIALADTALDPNQDRYYRNDLELELIRDLTRRIELNVLGAHHWTDFRANVDRNDSQAFEVGSEVRYQFASRHDFGVGASYVNQDFQEAFSRLGSLSNSISTYLIWDWNIADNIVFSASGGPAWILSEYDDTSQVLQNEFVGGRRSGDLFRANIASCDVDPAIGSRTASNCDLDTSPIPASDLGPRESFELGPGQDPGSDDVFTGFGAASLQITLASWNFQATYSRRQSTTSGGGLASSLDRFYMEFEFAPASWRWSPFLAGSWDRRETLTEATIVDFTVVNDGSGAAQRALAFTTTDEQGDRRENFTAITGVRAVFTRRQSATFEFRYRRTEGRDLGVSQSGADTYLAVFTFAYTLDPIHF